MAVRPESVPGTAPHWTAPLWPVARVCIPRGLVRGANDLAGPGGRTLDTVPTVRADSLEAPPWEGQGPEGRLRPGQERSCVSGSHGTSGTSYPTGTRLSMGLRGDGDKESRASQVCSGQESCQCRRRRFSPESGRSPGVGNDNPRQYFLASMDRGAWWATSPWDRKESDAAKQLSTHTWALNPRDYTVRLPRKTPLLFVAQVSGSTEPHSCS